MINRRLTLKPDHMLFFLSLYVIGIFVWDYTIVYQAALVIMFGLSLLLYRSSLLVNSAYYKMLIAFAIYFTFHTLFGFSVRSDLSWDYILTLYINIVASIVIVRILNNRDAIEKLLKVCIWTAFFATIYILIADRTNMFSGNLGTYVSKPFGIGSGYSHNDIPWIAGLATCFLSYFKIENRPVKFHYLLQLLFLIFVVLSGARKSMILVLFGLIIYPYFIYDETGSVKKLVRVLGAICALIVGCYLLFYNDTLYNLIGYRFEGFLSGLTSGGSFTESSAITRSIMYQAAIDGIVKKPFIGYGMNTFQTFPGSFGAWSHINYLEIWFSGGLQAAILYYAFYVYAFVKLLKNRNDGMGALMFAMVIFMLIHDLLSVSYLSRSASLVLSMISAYILIQDRNRAQKQNRNIYSAKY